jgi:multiple sugar transport system permease protein
MTRSKPVRLRHGLAPFLLVLPAVALFLVSFVVPFCYTIVLSFMNLRTDGSNAFGRPSESFVGLANYVNAVGDPEFTASLGRLGAYGLIVMPATIVGSLVLALLLDVPRQRLLRSARLSMLLPYAAPGVVAAILWGFLLLPGTSPVNEIANALGLPITNLLSLPAVYGSLALIAIWGGVGFNMIVIYTSLRAIPAELYDAARIDGCTELQIALRIKTPLVAPALVLTGIFTFIGTVQVYGEPMVLRTMTDSISSTFFPLMTVYNEAFRVNDLYGAAASSIILAVGVLVLSAAVLLVNNRIRRSV